MRFWKYMTGGPIVALACLLCLSDGAVQGFGADATRGEFGAARSNEPAAPAEKPKKSGNEKGYPFHGTVASVDASKGTVTIAGKTKNRPLVVTSLTKITKEGRRGSLSDVAVGDEIGGTAIKNSEGREEAKTLRIGAAQTKAKTKKAGE